MSFWARLAAWVNPPDPGPIVFEPAWLEILERNLPLYRRLPDGLRPVLQEQIAHFVRHKNFEACGGLELTDEMVLTIAGQACLLTMRLPGPPFPNLRSILIYPAAYRARIALQPEVFPYTTPTGLTYESADFGSLLEQAKARVDWEGFSERRGASQAQGLERGIGMCLYIERCGGGPALSEAAKVDVRPDGVVEVRIGSQANGQAHRTSSVSGRISPSS